MSVPPLANKIRHTFMAPFSRVDPWRVEWESMLVAITCRWGDPVAPQ